jgi:hypothetical protein
LKEEEPGVAELAVEEAVGLSEDKRRDDEFAKQYRMTE